MNSSTVMSILALAALVTMGQASICDEVKSIEDFDVEQWLDTPIRYLIAAAEGTTPDCSAVRWEDEHDHPKHGQHMIFTTSMRIDGETLLSHGHAVQREGQLNHFDLEFDGIDFHMVIIDTDYTGSTSMLFCSADLEIAEITATKNHLASEEYERRLQDIRDTGFTGDAEKVLHDDACVYNLEEKNNN